MPATRSRLRKATAPAATAAPPSMRTLPDGPRRRGLTPGALVAIRSRARAHAASAIATLRAVLARLLRLRLRAMAVLLNGSRRRPALDGTRPARWASLGRAVWANGPGRRRANEEGPPLGG